MGNVVETAIYGLQQISTCKINHVHLESFHSLTLVPHNVTSWLRHTVPLGIFSSFYRQIICQYSHRSTLHHHNSISQSITRWHGKLVCSPACCRSCRLRRKPCSPCRGPRRCNRSGEAAKTERTEDEGTEDEGTEDVSVIIIIHNRCRVVPYTNKVYTNPCLTRTFILFSH